MLRSRGTGSSSAAQFESNSSLQHEAPKPRPLRGLLRLLQGQIPTDPSAISTSISGTANDGLVSVYRYHGQTLRETQKELEKKKRLTKSSNIHHDTSTDHIDTTASGSDIPHSQYSMPFEAVVRRHKFVAVFVVQGFWNAAGNPCYSAHTLHLRNILANDYHDVMTTFVIDLGGEAPESERFRDEKSNDEETGTMNGSDSSHPFCKGTGFCLFPTTPLSTSTTLALLQITKIPAVVVLDVGTGRMVASDAILAIERNDSHTVINRWQSKNSGLSLLQQLGAVATCDCSHGPCCSASGGGCCIIQ